MEIFDLSHEISNETPVYPGDPKANLLINADLKNDGFVLHRLELSTHLATHIDAPGHVIENGRMLSRFPVSHFTGKGLVLKAEYNNSNLIEINLPDDRDFEHLIINCGWYNKWGSAEYFQNYPHLTESLAKKIADLPLKTVGFDTPSVDSVDSKDYPIHKIFLRKNILIIENLTSLNALNGCYIDLYAFPLKLKDMDGSPLRVIAVKK